MSDSELDYMSDKFFDKANDAPPVLLTTRERRRLRDEELKKSEASINSKMKELLRLNEGMRQAIAPNNKGFLLLQKMGYRRGEPLGKDGSDGIVEPIEINITTGRRGLGRDVALKEIQHYKRLVRKRKLAEKAKEEQETTEEFRKRKSSKYEDLHDEKDLKSCQKTCWELDEFNTIRKPEMPWFWPKIESTEDNTDEKETETTNKDPDVVDGIEYTTAEKLYMLHNYLRTTYYYCHWCGVHYDTQEDFVDSCPGSTKEAH